MRLLGFGLMRGAEVEVWLYGSMEAAVAGAGPPALPPGSAPQGETVNRFWIRIPGSALAEFRPDARAEVEVWLYSSMEAAVAGPPALPPGTISQGETINRFLIRILGRAVAEIRPDARGRGGGVTVQPHGGGCGGGGTAGSASWHHLTR